MSAERWTTLAFLQILAAGTIRFDRVHGMCTAVTGTCYVDGSGMKQGRVNKDWHPQKIYGQEHVTWPCCMAQCAYLFILIYCSIPYYINCKIFNIPDIYFIHNACYTIHLAPSICIVLSNPWLFPEKKRKHTLVPDLHTANFS